MFIFSVMEVNTLFNYLFACHVSWQGLVAVFAGDDFFTVNHRYFFIEVILCFLYPLSRMQDVSTHSPPEVVPWLPHLSCPAVCSSSRWCHPLALTHPPHCPGKTGGWWQRADGPHLKAQESHIYINKIFHFLWPRNINADFNDKNSRRRLSDI